MTATKKLRVQVSANTTVTGPDGVLYRAGDEFESTTTPSPNG